MIVSKSSLHAVDCTVIDNDIRSLDNVHIEEDGTVVASNRESVLIVSPIRQEIREKLILKEGDSSSVTLSSETIKDIIKFIGIDKKYKGLLEHCDIVESEDGATITCYDGKRSKAIQAKVFPKEYYPYVELVKRVYKKALTVQIKLNRIRFVNLLNTMNKICDEKSDFAPLYLEFSEDGDMILRAESAKTGQRVFAVSRGLTNKNWLEPENWEKALTGSKPEKKFNPVPYEELVINHKKKDKEMYQRPRRQKTDTPSVSRKYVRLRRKLTEKENVSSAKYSIINEVCELCGNHLRINVRTGEKSCSYVNCPPF